MSKIRNVSTGLRIPSSEAALGAMCHATRIRMTAAVDYKGILEIIFPCKKVVVPAEVNFSSTYDVQCAIEPVYINALTGLQSTVKIESNVVRIDKTTSGSYVSLIIDLGATVIPKGANFGLWTLMDNIDGLLTFPTSRLINHPTVTHHEMRFAYTSAKCGTGWFNTVASGPNINNNWTYGMTPIAILATVDDHVQTYTVVGDSIVFGDPDASGTGQNGDTWHNLGMCKKAGRYGNPTVNLGVSQDITKDWATNYVMRDAILRKCNSEVILMACGINDISAGQTESQLKTVVKTFLDQYTGVKKIYSTITPRASSTDTFATVVNQNPFPNNAGNASRRGFINTELRAGKCLEYGADYYWDRCIPSEYDYANSSGKWDFGPSAETPYAYTKDGLHPTSVGQDRIAYSSPPLPTQYFTIGVGGMYATQNAFLSASIPAIEGNVEVLDRSLPVNLLGAYTVKYTFAPAVQPWAVPTNYQYSYKWSY